MQEEVARLTCKLARSSSKAVNLRQEFGEEFWKMTTYVVSISRKKL